MRLVSPCTAVVLFSCVRGCGVYAFLSAPGLLRQGVRSPELLCVRVWQGHRIQHLTAPSPPALPPFPDGIHQNIKYKEKMQRAAAHERKLQKRRDRKARELALFATWRGTGAGAGAEADAAIRS